MDTNKIGRPAVRALAVILLASSAVAGLTACQSATASAVPAPARQTQTHARPFDPAMIERYSGRPVDRISEEIEQAIRDGQLPSDNCLTHHIVEHPLGGYHLVCVQARD